MIYLDNAATTLNKPPAVLEAVQEAMGSFGNAGRGGNDASLSSSRIIFQTREALNRLVGGTSSRQIVFTHNATESLNIAIRGLLNPGDHVITSVLEHNSVLRPLEALKASGVEVSYLPINEVGEVQVDKIPTLIQDNTTMIILAHGSNLTGSIIDLAYVGQLAEQYGLYFVVDAAQTLGAVPIDVQQMQIDVLCFTGHKGLLGPQGTGGLYVREGLDIRPLKTGGTGSESHQLTQPTQMPDRLEAGTLNSHGIAGLHAAVNYLLDYGVDQIQQHERELTAYFYNGIKDLANVTCYGPMQATYRCPIITLNIGSVDSSIISDRLLSDFDIATRSGAHCAPLAHDALGTTKQGAVRFSLSHFTTIEEIDQAIAAIHQLAQEYSH